MTSPGNWSRPRRVFDAALKGLTDGIERRDAETLHFLGIYLD